MTNLPQNPHQTYWDPQPPHGISLLASGSYVVSRRGRKASYQNLRCERFQGSRLASFLIRDWRVCGMGLSVCEGAHSCFFQLWVSVNSALSRSHPGIKEISWVVFLRQWFLIPSCRDVQSGRRQEALPYMTDKWVLESTSTLRLGALHREYIWNTNCIMLIPLSLILIHQRKDTHAPQDSWRLD